MRRPAHSHLVSRPAQANRGIQQLAIASTIRCCCGEATLAVMHGQGQRPSRHTNLVAWRKSQAWAKRSLWRLSVVRTSSL